MSYKKSIITITTLVVLLLLTMSTTIQAASVGKVYDLEATMEGTQIILNWDSVSNAAGYNVYVNDTNIGYVYSNEAALINFSENTTYRIKVVAFNSRKQEGTASNEIRFTTTVKENLNKVENLEVSQNNGYVTLNWSKVNKATKYQVFVDVPNYGNMCVGEVSTTNAMIKGFQDGARYGFSVRAYRTLSNGTLEYGETSNSKYITVDYDNNNDNDYDYDDDNYNYDEPDRVTNVNAYDITETTVKVEWNKVSDADGYKVLLSRNYGEYEEVADRVSTYVKLTGLKPDNYYKVVVYAYKNVNGKRIDGPLSSYESFTTEKEKEEDYTPARVKGLDISDVTKNSAYVTWSKVSNATGYNIYVSKDGGSYKYNGYTSGTKYTINGLSSNTDYSVKVAAYKYTNGREYEGEKSVAESFTTRKNSSSSSDNTSTSTTTTSKLGKVTHLSATVKNVNEAYLTWWPVDGAAGYEVRLIKDNGKYEVLDNTTYNNSIIYSDKLDYSTTYNVRVIAYKYDSYGNYVYSNYSSDKKSFTTGKYDKKQNSPEVGRVQFVNPTVMGSTVFLNWGAVDGAEGYEIDFTDPGTTGSTKLYPDDNTNSKLIRGITDKNYNYTARVRAYKTINGTRVYGPYSGVAMFKGK